MNQLIHGDCIESLKTLPAASVDLICTDPPYGYSFMGKDWDKSVPSVEVWRECLRVLKPGGFALIMSAPRSDVLSRMIVRIEDAGFRVDFSPIYWTYASGFPKALNIGKAVDKRIGHERPKVPAGIGTDNVSGFKPGGTIALNGSYGGFQPKPAVEVIIVAMKPLSEKTFVGQALKNGKGVTWLDDCRIPTSQADHEKLDENRKANRTIRAGEVAKGYGMKPEGLAETSQHEGGRFPANILVSDDVLNHGRVQKSGKAIKHRSAGMNFGGGVKPTTDDVGFGNTGSYSRYFDLDAWWAKTFPFLIVPKASRSEKDIGLEHAPDRIMARSGGAQQAVREGRSEYLDCGFNRVIRVKNNHPTVKPIKLMSYLITLGSRQGNIILDPFVGSGTTALAAAMLGRQYLGIERERAYLDIAMARMRAVL